MKSHLPIGIEELLGGAVETARLELKASWDPNTTGHQVIKTLCAFANDLQNLNGGYVVLDVVEQDGVAVRPANGLSATSIDAAQKWIHGNCKRIDPTYMPVMDFCEVDGKQVLVLWAPASDVRPHQAPDGARGSASTGFALAANRWRLTTSYSPRYCSRRRGSRSMTAAPTRHATTISVSPWFGSS
jgi:ATP-dependent DNA helicase RecG